MKEKFSLKDALFNQSRVEYLADLLMVAEPNFNKKGFVAEVVDKFPELELKARISWMAVVLKNYLPDNPTLTMKLIVAALPPILDPDKTDDDFGSFILAPLGEYVVQECLDKKYLKQALVTLREITMRFSMEDATRAFINNFPEETLAAYDKWVTDKNYHVRRLVSESTRPLLPWSKRLLIDYKIPIKYLDILHADKTRYVTRSVANHLNDISKKDPELVVATLKKWQKKKLQKQSELDWMTKHALRTLIKQGNSGALQLLGYESVDNVGVSKLSVPNKIKRGEVLHFSFAVQSLVETKVLIDYVIDFVKVNGQTKPKVFKLKQLKLPAQESVTVIKKHHLKADATTFKLNSGQHTLTIQINGQKITSQIFTIL